MFRGHVQTIFGKISVIMTLRGVACDANFFVCVLLSFVNYYSKILLQLCNFSTGHFIAELTHYQMLESGKDTSLHRLDDRGNVS